MNIRKCYPVNPSEQMISFYTKKYREKSSGKIYNFIAVSNIGANNPGFIETAFYSDLNGKLYSLLKEVFNEKFERVDE